MILAEDGKNQPSAQVIATQGPEWDRNMLHFVGLNSVLDS